MCNSCTGARSDVARHHLLPMSLDSITVCMYAVVEGYVSRHVEHRYHDSLDEDERTGLVTDTAASMGAALADQMDVEFTKALHTALLNATRSVDEQARVLVCEGSWSPMALPEELEQFAQARDHMETMLMALSAAQHMEDEDE